MSKGNKRQPVSRAIALPSEGASLLDRDIFLRKYKISLSSFESTGLSWADLCVIREDHIKRTPGLLPTSQQIAERIRAVPAAHSLKFRIKDPEHLIEKIIRKNIQDPDLKITPGNYRQQITDLIGLRVLHLFKDDWTEIHNFILTEWDLVEKPTANIRRGDPEEFIEAFRSHGCRIREHRLGYRSVHYLLKTQPTKETHIAEVQVRTIFEEGWSEIDHAVRYPTDINDPLASRILGVLNRIAGGADELGAYIRYLHRANDLRLKSEIIAATQREEAFKVALARIRSLNLHSEAHDDLHVMLEGLREINTPRQDGMDPLIFAVDYMTDLYRDRIEMAVHWIKQQHYINGNTRIGIVWGVSYNSKTETESIKSGDLITIEEVEDGGMDAFDLQHRTIGRLLNDSPLPYTEYMHSLKIAFGATPWKARISHVGNPYKASSGETYADIEGWLESEPLPEEVDEGLKSTTPVSPTKPTKAAKPAKPAKPTKPAKASKPAKSAQPAKPIRPQLSK